MNEYVRYIFVEVCLLQYQRRVPEMEIQGQRMINLVFQKSLTDLRLAATMYEPALLSVGPQIAGSLLRSETLRKLSGCQSTGIKFIQIKVSSLAPPSHFLSFLPPPGPFLLPVRALFPSQHSLIPSCSFPLLQF